MLLAEETAVEALHHGHTPSAATAWKAAEKIGEAWDSATRTCRCPCGSRRARWW